MAKKTGAQLDREIAQALTATSGAGIYDPKRLKAVSRSTQHGKRKEIEARFPIGTYVKGTRLAFAFDGVIGKVTGYDLGMDEDEPRVRVRLLAPVKYMGRDVRVTTFDKDAVVSISKDQLAAEKLLKRFAALDVKREQGSEELRLAGRESDGVDDDETHGHPVTPARKAAAARRWAKAVHADRAVRDQMGALVLKIRAIDPARVPWGWQNTR